MEVNNATYTQTVDRYIYIVHTNAISRGMIEMPVHHVHVRDYWDDLANSHKTDLGLSL